MTRTTRLSLSVCLVSIALGSGAQAQVLGDDGGGAPAQLIPMEQLQQLQEWMQLCAEGRPLPGERDCAAVERVLEQPDLIGTLGLFDVDQAEDPEPKAREPDVTTAAPEPEARQPDATAVAPDPEPEAQQPDATAAAPDPEPEAQQPDATAAAPDPEPEAQQPDATAAAPDPEPEAQQPDAIAAAPDPEPETQQPDATALAPDPEPEPQQPDATVKAPDPEPETQKPDATAVAPDPEPEVQQPDPQAQADAVKRIEQNAPVAAATADRDVSELTSEIVTNDDIRRSDQDFKTGVAETSEPKAKDDGDEDRTRKLAGAALLGLGAAALAEILDQNDRVVTNSGDRVVVERDGQFRVLRNDDVLLRRPGAEVQTQTFDDGSTRNILTYQDGTVVETIRAADGRVVRRARILPDGQEVVLFDDTQARADVDVTNLPDARDGDRINYRDAEVDALARALAAQEVGGIDRRFSLAQVRNIDAVRRLVPVISVDSINFETGSAAIRVEEAEELAALGNVMRDAIARNPGEVFLIEGHTDAVGSFALNLALSDRRAESVALALTEYFDVPPENMVLQGYGEGDLLIQTDQAERANRRAAVRRITSLLQ